MYLSSDGNPDFSPCIPCLSGFAQSSESSLRMPTMTAFSLVRPFTWFSFLISYILFSASSSRAAVSVCPSFAFSRISPAMLIRSRLVYLSSTISIYLSMLEMLGTVSSALQDSFCLPPATRKHCSSCSFQAR